MTMKPGERFDEIPGAQELLVRCRKCGAELSMDVSKLSDGGVVAVRGTMAWTFRRHARNCDGQARWFTLSPRAARDLTSIDRALRALPVWLGGAIHAAACWVLGKTTEAAPAHQRIYGTGACPLGRTTGLAAVLEGSPGEPDLDPWVGERRDFGRARP